MKAVRIIFGLGCLLALLNGCMGGAEARKIRKVVEQFIVAVNTGDNELAVQLMLDRPGWAILHADIANGVNGRSATDDAIATLEGQFRRMVTYFDGRDVKVKSFRLGSFRQDNPKHPEFKDSQVILEAGGTEYEFIIPAIVSVAGNWRIVDLSGNSFY